MLTNQILSYYNQLLAASIMYLTIVDPLKDLASTLSGHTERDSSRLWTVVVAEPSQDHDYYKTLGVGKDATKQEIHRAFRQLAKKYHPDKNKDKSATEEFIKIFKAYETLSDEKKRKEYDQQKDSAQAHSSSWSSTTSNMNDFDINDFFKQYEDQFMRHAQHHQHHDDHSHHQQHYEQHQKHHQDHFNFHGINLDELFSNIDDDEFSSFGKWFDSSNHNHNHLHHAMDGHFGDGASYFGTHFPSPMHDTVNQYHQMYNHYNDHQATHSYSSCQTITRQVNGMTMTQTSCS